jgi:hypothetical protein
MFIRPVIGGSSIPTEFAGATIAYDFAGGSLVNLADPGVNDLTTPVNPPTVVTGLNGDAVFVADVNTRLELVTTDVYLGPESTTMGWFYIPGTGIITGGIWEVTRNATGDFYENSLGGRTDQKYITLRITGGSNFDGVVPTYGQNKWNFFCIRTYASGWDWNVADTTTFDTVRTGTGTITYADGVNATRVRPGCSGSAFYAHVDSFRMFSRALTDDEVLAHWNGGTGLPWPA